MTKPVAARAMNFELRVLDHQPGKFVFSVWGNVLFFFWVAPVTPEAITRLVEELVGAGVRRLVLARPDAARRVPLVGAADGTIGISRDARP